MLTKSIENLDLKLQIQSIITKFLNVFSQSKFDIGLYNDIQHKIDTGSCRPVRCPNYKIPIAFESKVYEQLDELLNHDIIVPCSSPWNSPLVVIKKKNTEDLRLCVDFRKINSLAECPVYPIPDIQEIADCLQGKKFFSVLDISKGYYHILIAEEDRMKTAFSTKNGQYMFKRLCFGLSGAPCTFIRAMTQALKNELWKQCIVYMDDILVFGSTIEEHNHNLECVLRSLKMNNLKVSPEKCKFLQSEVKYIGHVFCAEGIKTDPEKVKIIKEWQAPKDVKGLQKVLGLINYYRKFVKNISTLTQPLYDLLNCEHFIWTSEHEKCFNEIKTKLITSPILSYPSKEGKFILETDSSNYCIGGVLKQEQNGIERVIAYGSRKLSKSEVNYCITKKEFLAIIYFVRHYKHYLLGKNFLIRTDHEPLKGILNTAKKVSNQFVRWKIELEQYNFDIEYIKGNTNIVADTLSRMIDCKKCGEIHTENEKIMSFDIENKINKISQLGDNELKIIYELIKSGILDRKMPNELRNCSQSAKILWARRGELIILNETLYLRTKGIDKLVVPLRLKEELVKKVHNNLGHIGIRKTIDFLKSKYYWPKLEECVVQILNNCSNCMHTKDKNSKERAPLQSTVTGYPFEKIAIDITGPLLNTPKGNKYILGIIDHFSKYTALIPLKSTESHIIADAILTNWICYFGAPVEIVSDNAQNFKSQLIQELSMICGCQKSYIPAYYPQANGIIERLFRTAKSMIKTLLFNEGSHWDECIPFINMALRNTIQDTTQISPHEAIFGERARLPIEWQFVDFYKNIPSTLNEYNLKVINRLRSIHKFMREKMKATIQKQTDYYNKNRLYRKIDIGQNVLVRQSRSGNKMKMYQWIGPYKVIKKLGEWTYVLTNEDNETIVRSYNQLKVVNNIPLMNKSVHKKTKNTIQEVTPQITKRVIQKPMRLGFS